MNLSHFHHTCMAGGKIYNSSRILHALLKKSYKTGGCILKSSDQDHRIRVGGGGVGGLNSGLNFSIKSSEPHPLGKIHNPALALAALSAWQAASLRKQSAGSSAPGPRSSHVRGAMRSLFMAVSSVFFAAAAAMPAAEPEAKVKVVFYSEAI